MTRLLPPAAMIALAAIIALSAGATQHSAADMPAATPTPTYQECPCWRPGDPDNTCVCPEPEPDGHRIYLPIMEIE